MIKTRVNGYSIFDYFDETSRETGRAQVDEPLYKEAVSNGYAPFDFIADSSLVLYLPLGDFPSSTFKSVDAYQLTGTVTGALWRPNGRFFDNTDDVINTPQSGTLVPGTGDFTVGMWVKWDGVSERQDLANIGSNGWIFRARHDLVAGQLFFFIDDGTLNDSVSQNTIASSTGVWYLIHATLVRATKTITFYVNEGNALSGTYTAAVDDINSTDDFKIGAGADTTIDGTVGEVWIYSQALSAAAITHNFNVSAWRYQ